MPLPVRAEVQAAQSFVRDVRAAEEFLYRQSAAGAPARYDALVVQLKKARDYLRWNPGAGRPSRLLQTRSSQGRVAADRAVALAASHGLPALRELILKPYVLLYAHGEDRVVLLALKHERQLTFQLREPGNY